MYFPVRKKEESGPRRFSFLFHKIHKPSQVASSSLPCLILHSPGRRIRLTIAWSCLALRKIGKVSVLQTSGMGGAGEKKVEWLMG